VCGPVNLFLPGLYVRANQRHRGLTYVESSVFQNHGRRPTIAARGVALGQPDADNKKFCYSLSGVLLVAVGGLGLQPYQAKKQRRLSAQMSGPDG